MKFSLLVVLCFAVALQAAEVAVKSTNKSLAQTGDNPWFVHLRIAIGTSGLLETCAGSLIHGSFVLTSASCLWDARFVWNRFGAVNFLHPELVLEANQNNVIIHNLYHPSIGDSNIGLIKFSRYVHSTTTLYPIALENPDDELVETGKFCGFGEENDAPGELLYCWDVTIEASDNSVVSYSDEVKASRFDSGAPLVVDGVQVGLLTQAPAEDSDNSGTFLRIASFRQWIEQRIVE